MSRAAVQCRLPLLAAALALCALAAGAPTMEDIIAHVTGKNFVQVCAVTPRLRGGFARAR